MVISKSKRVKKNLDAALAGNEPFIDQVESRRDPRLTRIFNYYTYLYDEKQSKSWLVQWMRSEKYSKDQIEAVKDGPDWMIGSSTGWYAKMALNGTKLSADVLAFIHKRIKQGIEKYAHLKNDEEEPTTNVVNIQSRIHSKNRQIMALAEEEVIDSFMLAGHVAGKSSSMYDFLIKHEASAQVASQLKAFYLPQMKELFETDPQVKESYGNRLRSYQNFYSQIIDDLDRYLNNKKVVRIKKPKVIKMKPASKIVEKLQYLKEFPELKLVSVEPSQIVGASSLWTYNVKYKVLTCYHALEGGFSVKGTTLTNYSVETSIGKRLRKPDMVLNEVIKAGRVALKKIISDLKTSEIKPNGRIGKDTMLIRVIR